MTPERKPKKTVTLDEGQVIDIDGLIIECRKVWGRRAKFAIHARPPSIKQVPADPPAVDKFSTPG